jgi:hypothetical protein
MVDLVNTGGSRLLAESIDTAPGLLVINAITSPDDVMGDSTIG